MSRDHRKLDAFHLADAFVLQVYEVTRKFPRSEDWILTAQIRRAAVSCPSNIVEGCACRTEAQYVEHLNRAFGSLREAGYQLDLARRLGYADEESFASVTESYERVARCLGALLRSLDDRAP